MKDRELKDREVKIKRHIEELKPIIVSIDDMDKFEQKEMKKISSIKNTLYDWLISYIHEPIRKSLGGFKDKIVSLFKTSAPKKMYNRSDNIRFTSYNDAKKVIDELLESLRSRYQGNLETSIRESDFIFDSVQLTY